MRDPSRPDLNELRAAVRERITMVQVCAKLGVEGRKEGHAFRCRCPFHAEKSASFLIGGRSADQAHCFGCDWHGDLFAFYEQHEGVTHVEAVHALAVLTGVISSIPDKPVPKWLKPAAEVVMPLRGAERIEHGAKPLLPRMRALKADEIEALAGLRGLSVESVRFAANVLKRVGFCEWPLYLNKRSQRWVRPCETHWLRCGMDTAACGPVASFPSWVITDDERWVAQFRKLNGEKYEPRAARDEQGPAKAAFKSWTLGTGTWPVGCAEIGTRTNVLFMEGGPDMLAAIHFLHYFGRLRDVAVVGMLGGGRIPAAALPYFAGKRVRIICHADAEKVKVRKKADGSESVMKSRPGVDAAARWSRTLQEAGAAVKTFFLGDVTTPAGVVIPGLRMVDGEPVNDCNDLVKCTGEELDAAGVRDAFCEWREGWGN